MTLTAALRTARHPFAHNVRRLMARHGMTLRDLAVASGLHLRTVKAALNGRGKPHARTLHRLAAGLGVAADELFEPPSGTACQLFDSRTNLAVQEVVERRPELFCDWTAADFEELYSHFGTGGCLSDAGAARVAESINIKKSVHQKVAVLLESGEAQVLIGMVELLYQKVAVVEL